MLNAIGWLVAALVGQTGEHYPYLGISIFLLALPVAWLFVSPPAGIPSEIDIVAACCLIGLNSFLWGYGLAAILRRWFLKCEAQPSSSNTVPLAGRD
jgi:hypothetical protein